VNGIITLTTDLNEQDYYLATVKGNIINAFSGAQLVNISNSIKHFDVIQAAVILKNSWQHYPVGTTHLIIVEDRTITARKILMAEESGHYFIAPDNGIFSLLFDDNNLKIFELNKKLINPDNVRLPSRLLMAKTAASIASGSLPQDLGTLKIDVVRKSLLSASVDANKINGAVIFIDQFNNMITNISKSLFEEVGKGRGFTVSLRRGDWLNKISTDFNDVNEGEMLAHFNANENLVISINKMKTARLTGLSIDSPINIQFI
jgi:S-adenosyl-L-methionine hydrolase (adenosine-forming)